MGAELGHLLDSLGWAIVHSLWQGTLAALAVIVFRAMTHDRNASLRYSFQILCLFACSAAFLVTFGLYLVQNPLEATHSGAHLSVGTIVATLPAALSPGFAENSDSLAALLHSYAPFLGILWCAGFVLLALRYMGAFVLTQQLRTKGISEVPAFWQGRFQTLVLNSGIRRHVEIFISDRVAGPLTLGFFKPIVLVPASFFAGMPAEQIEAILLHEIAHVRRHDYLINLFQTTAKTVFFFHPAVHYISRKIDHDREHACDDFAVALTKNPQALARGLASLRLGTNTTFAIAADNGNTPLVARLKRLRSSAASRRRPEHVLTSALTLIIAAGVYLGASPFADAAPQDQSKDMSEASSHPSGKLGNYRFENITVNGQSFTAKIADDGSRWINVGGVWYDVDKHPEKITALPARPVPPAPPVINPNSDASTNSYESRYSQYKVDQDYYEARLKYAQLEGAPKSESTQRRDEIAAQIEKSFSERAEEKSSVWNEAAHGHKSASLESGIYIDGKKTIDADDTPWLDHVKTEMANIDKAVAEGKMSAKQEAKARKRADKHLENHIKIAMEKREAELERAEDIREREIERAEEIREREMERAEEQREREIERERMQERQEAQLQRHIDREVERAVQEALEHAEDAIEDAEHSAKRHKHDASYDAFTKSILLQLKTDGLISPEANSVKITFPGKRMTVNGKTISRKLEGNYCGLFENEGIIKSPSTTLTLGIYETESDTVVSRHIDHVEEINEHKEAALTLGSNLTYAQSTNWAPVHAQASAMNISFTHPTPDSRVSQRFGAPNHKGGQPHNGIDLAAPAKTDIKASAPGVVTMAKADGKWGKRITISHPNGFETHYAHVGEICVAEGDKVKQGESIASVGSTGAATRPHLHFEIRQYGQNQDPEKLIRGF